MAAGDAGVHVFDIRQPARPVEVAFYQTPDSARSVTVVDNMVYVSAAKGYRTGGVNFPVSFSCAPDAQAIGLPLNAG